MLGVAVFVTLWFGWSVPQKSDLNASISIREHPPGEGHAVLALSKEKRVKSVGGPHLGKDLEGNGANPQKGVLSSLPPVDINRGTIDELQALPGIGPVLAERIVTHRELQGPFKSVGDLTTVRGIGEIRLARLRPFIEVK